MAPVAKFNKVYIVLAVLIIVTYVNALPLQNLEATTTTEVTTSGNDTNGTFQDLYVIKETQFEIGILTDDGDNSTDDTTTIRNEKVQITYFNPGKNGQIDLSKLPFPLQTNISGQQFTGFVPVADVRKLPFLKPQDTLSVAPITPTAVIDVVKNVSTNDPKTQENILTKLHQFFKLNTTNSENTTVTTLIGSTVNPNTILSKTDNGATTNGPATSTTSDSSTVTTPTPKNRK